MVRFDSMVASNLQLGIAAVSKAHSAVGSRDEVNGEAVACGKRQLVRGPLARERDREALDCSLQLLAALHRSSLLESESLRRASHSQACEQAIQ